MHNGAQGDKSRFVAAAICFAVAMGLAGPAWSTSFQSLGFLSDEHNKSEGAAVSADGSVVVGYSGNSHMPFIWDAANGMRNLEDVLAGLGVDMTGWRLRKAQGISADGMTVVGYGTSSLLGSPSDWEAWIARGPFEKPEAFITEGTPVAEMLGLLALACGCVLGGARTLHRKS